MSFTKSKLSEKQSYASILNSYHPVLSEDYVLVISFETSLQLELFKEIKHDLAVFLRSKLNNSLISISENVSEQDNSKAKVYTVDDKFRFLSQKNPALLKFKQQFNLDFD